MRLSCGCDKAVGVSLNRESVRTPEVDVVMTDGSDVSQGIDGIPGCRALTFALNGALHRVRHRFSVSHQCQCRAAAEALLAGLVDTSFPGMAVINRRVHRCVGPARQPYHPNAAVLRELDDPDSFARGKPQTHR